MGAASLRRCGSGQGTCAAAPFSSRLADSAVRAHYGEHPPAGPVGIMPGAGKAGGLRRGRGFGGLRVGEPVGGETPGAGPGQALGNDQPSARLQNPVQFAKAGRDVGPVMGRADRPRHRDSPVRDRQRLGCPLHEYYVPPGPSAGQVAAQPEHQRGRVDSGDRRAAARGQPGRTAGAAPNVQDPVPRAHARQVSDQAAESPAAHQHDRADDQARQALEALLLVSAAVLAIGCRHDMLLHLPASRCWQWRAAAFRPPDL